MSLFLPHDRADIINRLTAMGIAKEDLEVVRGQPGYELDLITVRIPDHEPARYRGTYPRCIGKGPNVLGEEWNSFGLSEQSCQAALSLALGEAGTRAERVADGLAEAIGVVHGGIVRVLDNSSGGFGDSSTVIRACDGRLQDPNVLVTFDGEPEVKVAVSLQVAYAISI